MSTKTALTLPLWATVFTVAGLLILCGLGTWQLQRLSWKNELVAQLDTVYRQPPGAGHAAAIQALYHSGQPPFFGRVTAEGTYDHSRAMLVGPRTQDGRTGYHLITPLTITGATLLVNRGWVTEKPMTEATGQVTVTGLLREPEKPNMFVPPNDPAKSAWYSTDITQMTQGLSAPLPVILYAESEEPDTDAISFHTTRPALRNNHKHYAFFWFSMAGVLVIVYALRFLRR